MMWKKIAALFAVGTLLGSLVGCLPLLAGGAAGGALVADDRRSAGAVLDDQTIETKIGFQVGERFKGDFHVNVTSYNGVVLLTGEVPAATAKSDIEKIARGEPKVRSVQNELTVGAVSSFGSRTNDTIITSRVKTAFVGSQKFHANRVKVVTENGVVYLLGLVTREEADAAVNIARNTSGVQRVVKVFEYLN